MRFPSVIAAPVISLILLSLPGAAPAQNQPNVAEADSAAIKQVCADFSENFSRHDAHGVATTFAEDADFTNMGGRHSHGRADIEKWFAALFAGNLKDSQRTDTVRSIRFFTPDLAEADADTVITGNTTGISALNGAQIISFRTNLLAGNGIDGATPFSISLK